MGRRGVRDERERTREGQIQIREEKIRQDIGKCVSCGSTELLYHQTDLQLTEALECGKCGLVMLWSRRAKNDKERPAAKAKYDMERHAARAKKDKQQAIMQEEIDSFDAEIEALEAKKKEVRKSQQEVRERRYSEEEE